MLPKLAINWDKWTDMGVIKSLSFISVKKGLLAKARYISDHLIMLSSETLCLAIDFWLSWWCAWLYYKFLPKLMLNCALQWNRDHWSIGRSPWPVSNEETQILISDNSLLVFFVFISIHKSISLAVSLLILCICWLCKTIQHFGLNFVIIITCL